jgi:hypothetical protein
MAHSFFQVFTVLFDLFAQRNSRDDIQAQAPDLSAHRARQTLYLFIPGNTPGIALFIIFGTTATFRSYMHQALVPQRWKRIKETVGLGPSSGPSMSARDGMARRRRTSFSPEKEERELSDMTTPTPNDGDGFSLAVYEPVRPARIADYYYNGRPRDAEWGVAQNDIADIIP